MEQITADLVVDAKGLACPMPIIRTKKAMKELAPGMVVEVQATDKGSTADLKAWAQKTGHTYLETREAGGFLQHYLRTGQSDTSQERRFPHLINNEDLKTAINNEEEMLILDVREQAEYEQDHITGALSMPMGELEQRINELSNDKPIYVICRTGNRSDTVAQKLSEAGFKDVVNVVPGMEKWNK